MLRLLKKAAVCLGLLVLTAPAGWASGGSVPLPEVQADDTGYVLTLGVTPNGAGSLNRSSGDTFQAGENITLNCEPIDEFVFDYWLAGDSIVSTSSSFTFTMPGHDTQLVAKLHYAPQSPENPEGSKLKYTLTLASQPTGTASFNRVSGGQVEESASLYMECYTIADFQFEHWQVGDSIVSRDQQFYFTMPGHNTELKAVCVYNPGSPENPLPKAKQYTVMLSSKPAGAGNFSWGSSTRVDERSQCDIYAYPTGDFSFREWQRDGQTVSTDQEYIFEMPAENVSLVAVFDYTPANPGNPAKNFWDASTGEAVIDDFTPGNLYNELFTLTKGQAGDVLSLIVSGSVNQFDWGVLKNCPACALLDLSRTRGLSNVPSYNFSNNQALTTVVLPSGIESIGTRAFAGCSSLTAFKIFTVTPPVLASGVFDGVGTMTVYVPAASVSLYQQADGWKNFTILPLENEVNALTVNLPAGIDVSIYKNMFIELINTQSGQKQRYVITDRTSYTFSSLIKNTTYNVYLLTAQDKVLGEIDGVEIVDKDVSVTFGQLSIPRALTINVVDADSNDVTGQVTITWLDAKGNFLTHGNTLANQMEGTTVKYRVELPQLLAMTHSIPEEASYVVQASNNITLTLNAIPKLDIKGTVRDAKTGQPIAGATVAMSQMLNGLYSLSSTTKTDYQGRWQMSAFKTSTEITASVTGYISETQTFDATSITEEIPVFDLKDINGTTIIVTLNYTRASAQSEAGATYPDPANVAFTIYNETTGQPVTDFSVQYPKIVLMDNLPAGTVLRVTATSKNQKFNPVEASATVDNLDRALITLPIKQLGGISASYGKASSTDIIGILYDADGYLVKKSAYRGTGLTIAELQDGNYTLVTMESNQLFNSIATLSQFAEVGLVSQTDYVANTVSVESGRMTIVNNAVIPKLDETKLYYTDSSTKINVNKSQVIVGQFITVSASVDFKEAYAEAVSNVCLIITLPAGSAFVDNSVMVNKHLASYTLEGDRVTIPLTGNGEQARFCIIPTKEGPCEVSAMVTFNYNGENIVQPIGSAVCNVKGLTIALPEEIATLDFVVSGTATAGSDVYVYVDDIPAGHTKVKPSGLWSCACALTEAENGSQHEVYARVVTSTGIEMLSETKQMVYDARTSQPASVSMSFYNGWYGRTFNVLFNLLEKTCSPASYMFYQDTDFTFIIDFTENDTKKVYNVRLVVFLNNGTTKILTATYNSRIGKWIAKGYFRYYALPTTVKVLFNDKEDDGTDEGNAHCDPILDPSGYVYEAVGSNRLEGVTATAYYKEVVEDMYGDLHENVVLWDAEAYAQENPLFTDENGMYQWDVPQGLWQVKFEKEGYETTYSEWLPVPPPQLDVNIAMTQLRQPAVQSARAYENAVELEFDKYMLPDLLTISNVIVMADGKPVEGTIVLLNEDADDADAAKTYASKLRFNAANDFDAKEVTLIVKSAVQSYAGIRMENDFQQTFTIEQEIKEIQCDEQTKVICGKKATLTVKVLPAEASKGKTLSVKNSSPMILSVESDQVVIGEDGTAKIVVTGDLPGITSLTFSVEGTDKTAVVIATVEELNGDVNGDGMVGIGDIVTITNVMAKIENDEDKKARADVNGDGEVGIGDIVTITNIMAGN